MLHDGAISWWVVEFSHSHARERIWLCAYDIHRYLASIEPLYKDYVLQRRADRKSYRDMGTFREWACEQLHAADFNFDVRNLVNV